VTVWLRKRLPDSEFFLISESPLTSAVAATAVPLAAITSAMLATASAGDGRIEAHFMGQHSLFWVAYLKVPLCAGTLANGRAFVNER
jgi:hypothetical protein